jgi:CHAT domain-containing protein
VPADRSSYQGALVAGNPSMPTVHQTDGSQLTLVALPAAQRESQWLAGRLGAVPLVNRAATETEIRRRVSNAPIIHLATHGFAYSSESQSRDSYVALAPGNGHDGLLTVGEVLDGLPGLSADLVVLSACQTGIGNLLQTEGTLGFQRAFLARGARSVLVSLWNVDEGATLALVRAFYAHWLDDRDRPSKAESLRRAQHDVRTMAEYAEPRFWAAFQLVGAK